MTDVQEETLSEEQIKFYCELMISFLQSPRFVSFINANFDILKGVDEDGVIHTRIVEVPHEEVSKRLKKMVEDKTGAEIDPKGILKPELPDSPYNAAMAETAPVKVGKGTIIKHPNSPAAAMAEKITKSVGKKLKGQ